MCKEQLSMRTGGGDTEEQTVATLRSQLQVLDQEKNALLDYIEENIDHGQVSDIAELQDQNENLTN